VFFADLGLNGKSGALGCGALLFGALIVGAIWKAIFGAQALPAFPLLLRLLAERTYLPGLKKSNPRLGGDLCSIVVV